MGKLPNDYEEKLHNFGKLIEELAEIIDSCNSEISLKKDMIWKQFEIKRRQKHV